MKKRITAFLSVLTVFAILITGTFAWINVFQSKTNEFSGEYSPPGGTLHDDFCNPNKHVYIENWGGIPLIVRIRLDEFMEIGEGAGLKGPIDNNGSWTGTNNPNNFAQSLIAGANINDKTTWKPHIPHDANDPTVCKPGNPGFHDYWGWQMGGQKYYKMAPFNQRESLAYVDTNNNEYFGTGGDIKQTLNATVLTMQAWISMGSPLGEYWVIDTDGWAYWADYLMPGTATGLLLKKVTLENDPEESYYYAINVLAQMATKNKSGSTDNGTYGNYEDFFNNFDEDHTATNEGKGLLDKIVNGDGSGGSNSGGITTDNGNLINNRLYLRQGETAHLTASSIFFGTGDVTWATNGTLTNRFTFSSYAKEATVKALDNAAVGSKLEITAMSVSNPNKKSVVTVVVIPKDAAGVVVGPDKNLYLDWGDNTFNKIDSDGNIIGPMICGGMDQKPGSADDRSDIVYSQNGVKLLGPNPDKSYQAKGADGKLGTADDEFWWKKPVNKDKPVGDLNFTGDESTGDFTKTPPTDGDKIYSVSISANAGSRIGAKLYVPQGSSALLTATINADTGANKNAAWSRLQQVAGFSISGHGNNTATVSLTSTVTEGSNFVVTATAVGDTTKSETVTVVAITKDATGVVIGADGNKYLDYGDNTFKLLNSSDIPVGQMICGGKDKKPGNSDDRTDIVFTKDGEKLLGPNADGSYQSKGPDGKLGTADDIKWWKKSGNENKPIGDLNFNGGNEPTDFTQTQPGTGIEVYSVSIFANTGTRFGDVLYVPQNSTVSLSGIVTADAGAIKNVSWGSSTSMTGFSFSSTGNNATLNVGSNTAIGTAFNIEAVSVQDTSKKASLTVYPIDGDANGVVIGGDGNKYLDYGDNTFRKMNNNGTTTGNPMICGGMDQIPGNSDDRTDIVFTKDGTKLLGPNSDGSYQHAGPDGKLGTADDVKYWKVAGKENEPVGNLNFPSDFTTTQPPVITVRNVTVSPESASIIKGGNKQFSATVTMSDNSIDNTGVTWTVLPAGQATIGNISGNQMTLTINSNATAASITLTATSIKNPAVSASITVMIEPDVYNDINNAKNGETIVIDGKEWIKVRNDSPSGTKYVLLMSKDTIGAFKYTTDTSTNIQYKESQIKNNVNNWWNNLVAKSPTLKKIAVEADIGVNESESWPSSGTGYYAHLPRHIDIDTLPVPVRYIDKTYWLATPTTDNSGAVGFQKVVKEDGTYGIKYNDQTVEARPIVWVDISKLLP